MLHIINKQKTDMHNIHKTYSVSHNPCPNFSSMWLVPIRQGNGTHCFTDVDMRSEATLGKYLG